MQIAQPGHVTTANASSKPELLVASLLHLMSHYTMQQTVAQQESRTRLASVIERHLHILSDLSNLPPVLRATCQQLSEQWRDHVQSPPMNPTAVSRMARLFSQI